MATLDGVYRIHLAANGSTSTLSLGMPPTGDVALILGSPDDQDPWRNSYQQWKITFLKEENKYIIKSVGSGLYFNPVHKLQISDTINVKSSSTPFAWSIVSEGPADTYSIRITPLDFVLTLEGSNKNPGTKALLADLKNSDSSKRSWVFRKARRSADERPTPAHPTLPSLKSGTYRLRNGTIKNYLTQPTVVDPTSKLPLAKGLPSSDNDDQVWEVQLQETNQVYFIKNKGTGTYLGGDGQIASGRERPAGVQSPVGWDIRQAEFTGEYSIHVPGTAYAVDYLQSVGWDASKEIAMSLSPKYIFSLPSERIYWYHNWYFEPVGDTINATSAPKTSQHLAPLKTGSYLIRNSGSRTLITQQEKLEDTKQLIRDPAIVTSNFESDNPFQEWKVLYVPSIRQYAIQSVGSNRWLSSVFLNQETNSASTIASDSKATWVIKQSEARDEYLIQLPGTQQSLTIYSTEKKDNERAYLSVRTDRPTKLTQRWIFEPLDGGVDLVDPNDSSDTGIDGGKHPDQQGGDDGVTGQPSEADRKKKAEEYLKSKPRAAFSVGFNSNNINNFGTASVLTHDEQASENHGPVLGGKSTRLDWLHDFRIEPVSGAADTYTIIHNLSKRKLTYPKPPQDGSPVSASITEEGLWEILKEDGVDTFVFVAKGTPLVMEVKDNTDATPVLLKYASGSYNQMWRVPKSASS